MQQVIFFTPKELWSRRCCIGRAHPALQCCDLGIKKMVLGIGMHVESVRSAPLLLNVREGYEFIR